ncbi:MAG: hypothetical protein HOY71_17370 [Nonomuraea sp.]|nr:hypothetical protein [Nonomuraea sp.]
MIQGPDAPPAPPVPPPNYWPDAGTQQPSGPKTPGWAKAVLAGAAVVTLVGGLAVGLRNVGGSEPPPTVALPKPLPTLDLPTGEPSLSGLPSASASESESAAVPSESATPSSTSTFPALKAVPEVCDLLPESLTSRLAPGSASEPGVQKDGYGALRKGCQWSQHPRTTKGSTLKWRSISVAVNVYPSAADAREDYDFGFDSMKDMGGTKEDNPGLQYLSTYGQVKDLTGVGDEAHAMYTQNQKGTTNVWVTLIMNNTTVEIRFFATDNLNGEINAQGKDTRPVPEAELMQGGQQIAEQVVKALTS